MAFFEIVAEFTSKLPKKDKRVMLQYLDGILTMTSSGSEEWKPLLLYRNSLANGEKDGKRANKRRRRDAGI